MAVRGASAGRGACREAWSAAAPVPALVPLHMAAARRLLLLLLPLAWAWDGGWLAGTVPEEERCTVERADASLTYSLFMQRFAFSRPVILRGVTDNSAFRALCTREKLLAAFGARPVRLSTANTYSYRKVDMPFREYVEQLLKPQDPAQLGSDTLYFFGDNNFTEWGPLFQQYVPPAFRIPGTSPAYSFGIAGSGSGVPFHWHGPGYSERWFLYPPDKTPHFHPNETTLAWLHHTYPALPPAERPLECTVRPGEPMEPLPGRSCTSLTVGGTPRSTLTPASSSPPSWGRVRTPEDTLLSSWS
ncbi:jmjC domain-containing protein 8 isoform X2 [Caloenas nicobarica]|uniref:jmjC domain-containing protein 8 isoform X2 n=1 Tax=Caloenas nicobarica TaxID=187106 RepID=UPI0032B876F5